jgi:TusA-related sulfurtransferase
MSTTPTLDLTGLKCPMPIVRLSQIIDNVATDSQLQISADDPAFEMDVAAWCRRTGNELVSFNSNETELTAVIRRGH